MRCGGVECTEAEEKMADFRREEPEQAASTWSKFHSLQDSGRVDVIEIHSDVPDCQIGLCDMIFKKYSK